MKVIKNICKKNSVNKIAVLMLIYLRHEKLENR